MTPDQMTRVMREHGISTVCDTEKQVWWAGDVEAASDLLPWGPFQVSEISPPRERHALELLLIVSENGSVHRGETPEQAVQAYCEARNIAWDDGERPDVDDDPDDLCPRCGGEKPVTERFCSDECADEYADRDRFVARDAEGATYTLDGAAITLEEFFDANPILFAADRAAILALQPGEEVVMGGGAAASFTLRRDP